MASVGALFGPVMVLWFSTLAILGFVSISTNPAVLKALSPMYALSFLLENRGVALVAMGAVVLSVTGAEALFMPTWGTFWQQTDSPSLVRFCFAGAGYQLLWTGRALAGRASGAG